MSARRAPAELQPAEVGARVLVVEDDVLVRAVIAQTLREAGCEVIEATCADEAIEVLGAIAAPDVLVTDVKLPGRIDGMALAAQVRRLLPGTRVIVTSGHAAAEIAKDVADVFLAKPFELWRLVGQVRILAARA